MSCPTPGPPRLKGFSVPLSRVIAREYEKALCACASFYVCFFLSERKCINCNSICPVCLRTSMRWRFSLLIGLDWGAKLRVTFLRNMSDACLSISSLCTDVPTSSGKIGRGDVVSSPDFSWRRGDVCTQATASLNLLIQQWDFFKWFYYSSDWTHLRNSSFSISSLSGCKIYKRWNYRMIKSNFKDYNQNLLNQAASQFWKIINFIVDAQIELCSVVNTLLEKRFFYNCISWSLMIETDL